MGSWGPLYARLSLRSSNRKVSEVRERVSKCFKRRSDHWLELIELNQDSIRRQQHTRGIIMRLFQSLLVLLIHLFVNKSTAEGKKIIQFNTPVIIHGDYSTAYKDTDVTDLLTLYACTVVSQCMLIGHPAFPSSHVRSAKTVAK